MLAILIILTLITISIVGCLDDEKEKKVTETPMLKIAFTKVVGNVTNLKTLIISNADGTEPIIIDEGDIHDLEWSHDGLKLLYEFGNGTAKVVNQDGTGKKQIAYGRYFKWSPDDLKIVSHRGPNDNRSIYVMDSDGTNETKLTSGKFPEWLQDGKRIFFNRDKGQYTKDSYHVIDIWKGSGHRGLFHFVE